MVSTVTISTISVIAASSIGMGVSVFLTLLLIGFLTGKELFGATSGNKRKLLARSLTVSIVPLIMGFTVIVGIKVAEILA